MNNGSVKQRCQNDDKMVDLSGREDCDECLVDENTLPQRHNGASIGGEGREIVLNLSGNECHQWGTVDMEGNKGV